MHQTLKTTLAELLHRRANPITGSSKDYDPLLDLTTTARLVLLGEASHGTHEFYRERTRITRRLIDEHGFDAVAVEADWPDAYRVNRWVQGVGDDRSALDDIRLERAIGVIYRPESERVSHYFEARLPQQFDALLHFDVTQAVEPLDRTAGWDHAEPPETFPTGL